MTRQEGLRKIENILVFMLLMAAFLLSVAYYSAVFEKAPQEPASEDPLTTKVSNGKPTIQQPIAEPEDMDFYEMEKNIHAKVNAERAKMGLSPLLWNDELAAVAREHSEDLAEENEPLTEFNLSCHRPFIHHEGFTFGLQHYDRLLTRGIHYFNYSGENIFITSGWKSIESYVEEYPEPCPDNQTIVRTFEGPDDVLEELDELKRYVSTADRVSWSSAEWRTQEELERYIVDGWLGSPGHKELMLDSGFDEAGIGVAEVNDFYIVTEVFIHRMDCGYKGGQCCVTPGYYPSCYTPLRCVNSTCYS
jgi:uncharacterized protein YkwD